MDPFSRRPRPLHEAHLKLVPQTWATPLAKATDPAGAAPDYQWLHDIADSAAPAVRRAFLQAISEVQDSVKEADLAAAVEAKDARKVLAVLDLDKLLPEALGKEFQTLLEDNFVAAGRSAPANTLPPEIGQQMRFDLTNPHAQKFIRDYDFKLIRQLTDDTRDGIKQVVSDAFAYGGHPYEQAKQIKSLIGLTTNQSNAVLNYQSALRAEDRPADQVDRMTGKYGARMLRRRAETIARTETLRASNAGTQASWQQAANEGLLNRTRTRRQWVVALDDRLCPICAAIPLLNPTGVTLDGMFITPQGPVVGPPIHPSCRCTTVISAF